MFDYHMSTAEALRYLGCSRTTFWKVRKAGEIRPTGYLRGAARYSRNALDELLRCGVPRELAGITHLQSKLQKIKNPFK